MAGARPLALLLGLISASWASGSTGDETVADLDFRKRCSGAGVVRCVGFDDQSDIAPDKALYPAGDGRFRGSIDPGLKASGAGSLRFEIPPNSGQNSSGYWLGDLGAAFGQNSRFHVQWRQRFSPSMVATRFGGGGWKQIILHRDGPSCAAVQVVIQNINQRGVPQGYSDCGADGFSVTMPDKDTLVQQGDYNCLRRSLRPDDCAEYVPDQWMTFYLDVKVGTYGQPNSSVTGWVAYASGPLRKFIDQPNWRFDFDNSAADAFRKVQLTPYNTGKSSSLAHPTAYTWYDELIVSRQPIAAPASAPPTPVAARPAAPPVNAAFAP